MAQVMQRKHQFWCALKYTERSSLPIRHSYIQIQLWSDRMNQMDASARWGTVVLPIARSLCSATDQDGARRDLDRGAVPLCRRRNIQTWHAWRLTAMQEYTETTGATMFKGREMLPSGELRAPFPPAVIHTMNATREHAQARHCSRDLPPVGGKWRNRMQCHSLAQEKNPAEAALPELCQMHTWQWLSIQLEGKPCADLSSSSGAPSTWAPLCQPGMRWPSLRHSLPIIGCDAGMGSSVRSVCSGTALMQKWPTTTYEPCWQSFSPCKEPHFSCPAGNGVKPSLNQTSIMPSRVSLAVSSGHWFRNTFLMSGRQRLRRNQGLRKTKVAEATNRRNDRKGEPEQILNFPPVGGMPAGDTICQIMALRGHLRAQKGPMQGKGLGSWEANSQARTCAMTIKSQRMKKLHPPLLRTSAWYQKTTPFEPAGIPRMWNKRCGIMGILRKTWSHKYRKYSRRCRLKRAWNCFCGHGNMWTVESKYSYKMTLQLSLAFQCGSSYMPWKQQKLHKNAQSMIHTWQPNPATMGISTTEQHQAGREPNTHIHSISYSQALGQERVHGKGGGRNGQDRTSDTVAVNWGKRARRGKNKRTYQRIKRASDRMRFWYPRHCRATLRYDKLRFLMYSLSVHLQSPAGQSLPTIGPIL